MKKILVPTDFSKYSENALEFAVKLAQLTGAELNLVNFIEPLKKGDIRITGEVNLNDQDWKDLFTVELFRKNKERLLEITSGIEFNGSTLKTGLVYDTFKQGVEDYVEKYECDCVIIGTTGEENAEEFFTGNHTEKLIEGLGIPVISVKHRIETTSISDIVLGLDLMNQFYKHDALDGIKSVANAFNAKVHIVDVIEPKEDRSKESVKTDLKIIGKEAGFSNFTVEVVENYDKEKGLLFYSSKVKASMIAVVSHSSHSFLHMFKHSFAEQLTKDSNIPVLSLNSSNILSFTKEDHI